MFCDAAGYRPERTWALLDLATVLRARGAGDDGITAEQLDREAADGCLIGRWADAREVAFPILWLASEESSYVTGAVLMVDGGRFVKTGL